MQPVTGSFYLIAFSVILSLKSPFSAAVEPHKDNFHKHEHFGANQEHDVRYDHEAFLGPEAEEFDHLTPEESKKRLRVIVVKMIDTNKDGLVSEDELRVWIEKQRKAFMYEDVDKRIAKEDKDGDGEISWEEYRKSEYGEWDNYDLPKDHNLRRQIRKKEYKFSIADADKNGKMNRDEYVDFEHPEENINMQEIALDEVIEDVDQNDDGLITVAEFLGQYHEEKEPPAWVVRHRAEFHSRFDKNKDGKMDREEAREWVFPEKNDSHDETLHLIDGTDENADGFLSVDEILLHWNLFVGSLATDHGNTLRKVKHTEL
ncbi:unnamed protein product [Pocillopora meandrina]|uniref:Reticulocalbin-3 n=1 Tax=Pocillopora meandrina TaxID=46732 RepID=A0AAU9VWM8_9CNID|nr:unnamed protein product [Pocillopora meandrina]